MSSLLSLGNFNVNLTASFGFTSSSLANTVLSGFNAAGSIGASQIMSFASSFQSGGFSASFSASFSRGFPMEPAPLPRPRPELSGPPAGKGLEKDPPGWPAGSVRTAGGYTVVPEGNTSWKVFNPGQNPSDKPATHVHGDPHVTEADGGKWDFTKTSDFTLPDGTKITAKTSSEKGYSVTNGLEITNGMDHVSVTGVNGKPTTSAVMPDGYEYRATQNAANPNRPEFKLGGDGDDWFMVKDGKMGEITGAHMDGKTGAYEQQVDGKGYRIDPNLRPPIGSPAWGNMLRDNALDFVTGKLGMPPWMAENVGQMFHQDHAFDQLYQNMQALSPYTGPFGGMYGMAFGFGGAFDAMNNMADAMNNLQYLQAAQLGFRAGFLY
ncbi:MAG: DUF1521 domain-containing protein [Pseudomonadota bacterium]